MPSTASSEPIFWSTRLGIRAGFYSALQLPDFAGISAFHYFFFYLEKAIYYFTQPLELYLLLHLKSQSQPAWLVRATAAPHALAEDVLSQCVIGDLHCTSPDALHYRKPSCSVTLAQ